MITNISNNNKIQMIYKYECCNVVHNLGASTDISEF